MVLKSSRKRCELSVALFCVFPALNFTFRNIIPFGFRSRKAGRLKLPKPCRFITFFLPQQTKAKGICLCKGICLWLVSCIVAGLKVILPIGELLSKCQIFSTLILFNQPWTAFRIKVKIYNLKLTTFTI